MILKKLINSLNAASVPAKATIWYIFANILQKCISFITIPIYTRIMTVDDFGKYVVYQSWFAIVSIFATLNLSQAAFNTGIIKFKNDESGYYKSMLVLNLVCSIFACLLLLLFKNNWQKVSGLSETETILIIVDNIINGMYSLWLAYNRFHYKYKMAVIVSGALLFFTPLMSVPLVLVSNNKYMAAIIGKIAVQVLCCIPPILKSIKKRIKFINLQYWNYALFFSLPLIPHFLSNMVLQQSDRIMISEMCGDVETAFYGIGFSLSVILQFVNVGIFGSFTPWVYKRIEKNNIKKINDVAILLGELVGTLNLFIIIFAPEIVFLIAPENYGEVVNIVFPLTSCTFLVFFTNMFSDIEYYYHETKFISLTTLCLAILNVILNYIFIGNLGYLAAAYVTLFCNILYMIIHIMLMRRSIKLHNANYIYNESNIFKVIVSFFGISILAYCLYNISFIIRLLLCLFLCFICVIKVRRIQCQEIFS